MIIYTIKALAIVAAAILAIIWVDDAIERNKHKNTK